MHKFFNFIIFCKFAVHERIFTGKSDGFAMLLLCIPSVFRKNVKLKLFLNVLKKIIGYSIIKSKYRDTSYIPPMLMQKR